VPDHGGGDADRHRAPGERSQDASTSQSRASIARAGFGALKRSTRPDIEERASMTSTRPLLLLFALVSLLLVAAPAGATDGAATAPVSEEELVPAPPSAEAAQTETTPTTPGGEEQPGDTETETTPDDGVNGPVDDIPENGAGGESAGGLPRTGLEVAGLAMIGLGLLMAGLALRPTSSWPPPRDRLSRSIRPR